MSIISPRQLYDQGIITVDPGKLLILPDQQIQPSGIDLRIDYFAEFAGAGELRMDGKKNCTEQRLGLGWGERKDYYHLKKGTPYMAYYVESCKLPQDVSGWIFGRSTLIRNGIFCMSMVYDPGYENVLACPVYPWRDFDVQRYSRFAQFVGFKNEGKIIYKGAYSRKKAV